MGFESILDEAKRLTSSDRRNDYDGALPNHVRIASFWDVLFNKEWRLSGLPVHPAQVSQGQGLVKFARQIYKPKRDNLVDTAGYAEVTDQIYTELAKDKELSRFYSTPKWEPPLLVIGSVQELLDELEEYRELSKDDLKEKVAYNLRMRRSSITSAADRREKRTKEDDRGAH